MTLFARGPVLVLLPDRNSPPKHDYTGAFRPASRELAKRGAIVREIAVPVVDAATLTISGAAKQRGFERAADLCMDAIGEVQPAHLVFLCHGWSTGLQLGFRSKKQKGEDSRNFRALLDLLYDQRSAGTLHSVCMLACSAGDEPASAKSSPGTGDNSIADAIRDFCGVPVVAHWTVGHAVHNPDLICFDASEVPLVGGTAIVRGTKLYRNARRLLRGDAWTSLPCVTSYVEMQALLSQG